MDFLSKARSNYGRQANVGPKHTLCRSARTFSELGTPIRSLQAPQRIHFVACQKSAEQPLTSRVVHQHHVQLSSPTRAVKMRRKLGHRRGQRAPFESIRIKTPRSCARGINFSMDRTRAKSRPFQKSPRFFAGRSTKLCFAR